MINVLPGALITRDVTVYSDATKTEPLDITGASVALTIFDAPNGAVVADLDTSIAILDAPTGKLYFTIEAAADYGLHILYYQVRLTEADSTATIVDADKLVVGVV